MPVFPSIPLPALGAPSAGSNGAEPALDPGGTSGVVPGLEASLLAQLQNYRPGDIGICEVNDKLQLTLPLTDWEWFGWAHQSTVVAASGSSLTFNLWQVPTGERAYIESVLLERTGGDNLTYRIRAVYPAGYAAGDGSIQLLNMSSGKSDLFWPDMSDIQTNNWKRPGPILLEAGAYIAFDAGGVGVAESTWRIEIGMRRTRVGKVRGPYE